MIEKLQNKIRGEISIALLLSMIIPLVGMQIGSYLLNDAKAQTALDTTATLKQEVKGMQGALQFLVEKNGGKYDMENGIVTVVEKTKSTSLKTNAR